MVMIITNNWSIDQTIWGVNVIYGMSRWKKNYFLHENALYPT